jgi:chromosome partitioning protein
MKTRVVAVANQKGGVGKTTTVVNLAACLGEIGQNVLVVDFDPQANATSGLGVAQQQGTSLYRALLGEGCISSLVQSTKTKGVDLVPSELDLAGSEVDIARMDNYLHCFDKVLAPMIEADIYNFIVVDCPPSLGILTMNALTASQSIVVPMQCEYYALEGLSVISRLMNQLHASGANPTIEIEGILMTMFDSRTNLAAEVVTEVRKHFGDKVYSTVIPRNVRLSEAPSHGMPVIQYDGGSNGAKAYRLLAEEFLARSKKIRDNQLLKNEPQPAPDSPTLTQPTAS